MKIKIPFKKLNEDGFDHVFLAFFVVILIAIGGSYYVVKSRAATTNYPIVNDASSKCLNNDHNLAVVKNPVEIYTCGDETAPSGDAHRWTIKGETIVNSNGYCLNATGRKSGDAVVIQQCDGRAIQQWTVDRTNHKITSKPSGLCLDVTDGSTADKARVIVATCKSTVASQKWTVKDTTPTPTISSFTASPASLSSGSHTTLSWAVTTGSTCSVTPGGPTNTTATSWTSGNLTANTNFTLTCVHDNSAAATSTVAVAVTAPPAEKFGYSAPSSDWEARLANVGGATHIKYRRIYFQSLTDNPSTLLKQAYSENMTPIISYKVSPWTWPQVASGAADADLKTLISNLNAVPGPKIVVLHHEPAKDGLDTDWAAMQLHALPMIKAGASQTQVGVIGNGWWWSGGAKHLTDAEIARYIPSNLISICDFIGADTYQDVNSTETAGDKMKNMVAWAGRVSGVKGIGLGEWNGQSAAAITSSMNVVKTQPLIKWASMWENGDAGTVGARLTGDRLDAFKAGIATTNPL